jgi:glycosyltransferase involved in cell wall biosynthesis
MWPILMQYPGVVVLHDFYLSGLLSYEELVNGKTALWTEQLFKSHGYHALQKRFDEEKIEDVKYQYPCNYEVLQHALGMIVHSEYAKDLACKWYRVNPISTWKTIPLLREAANAIDKKTSRSFLGLPEDALIVCSFGVLNVTKLNNILLQAFLHSDLSEMSNCYLIFVGENNSGEYAIELEKNIKVSGAKERIKITGWIDNDTFQNYLSASDIGVQLRAVSRGESSASVLDCMNYGLATIVNANGSMKELPRDALYMLEDDFEINVLVEALNTLGKESRLRKVLGQKAKTFIHKYHDPLFCGSRYYEVIESSYRSRFRYTSLIRSLAELENTYKQPSSLKVLSRSIAESSLPNIRQRQMLIDVSVINRNDMKTGIERVVRAQLLEIINHAPDSLRVEPVYLSEENGVNYRYARKFACAMLDIPVAIEEETVVVANGDIFYAPDFYPQGVVKAAETGLYTEWAAKGVNISFLIHDILPIQYPHFFPEGSSELHSRWMETITRISDRLICTSNTGAENVRYWIDSHNDQKNLNPNLSVEAVYLGSDIAASSPNLDLKEESNHILEQISQLPTFLMVGTIEPRKGHLQALSAFEILWEKGIDVNLVIVGNEGWKGLPDSQRRTIPEIVQRLQNHPKSNKHLFWLEGISDAFLEKLYGVSSALIAASEDEGFGLPLIEAAHHNLPVIARDIPVFREVAGDSAFYFSNSLEAFILADAITLWLEAYHDHSHILSDTMSCITWEESAQRIIELLLITENVQKTSNAEKKENNGIIGYTLERKEQKLKDRLPLRAKEIYQALVQKENRKEQR